MPRKVDARTMSAFGKVVRRKGVTYVWLADESGYSSKHVYRVATGKHPGTMAFHRAMWRILGVRYPLPKEVLS